MSYPTKRILPPPMPTTSGFSSPVDEYYRYKLQRLQQADQEQERIQQEKERMEQERLKEELLMYKKQLEEIKSSADEDYSHSDLLGRKDVKSKKKTIPTHENLSMLKSSINDGN